MYTVTVRRSFSADHYLTVPDPGPEGVPHTHDYEAVVRLSGEHLDQHGYLVDIDAVEVALNTVEARYGGALLNDLPEFDGNPSVERFAKRACERFLDELGLEGIDRIEVTLWESDVAAGSYERPL